MRCDTLFENELRFNTLHWNRIVLAAGSSNSRAGKGNCESPDAQPGGETTYSVTEATLFGLPW